MNSKIVEKLIRGEVGAIFQGKPEMGSRALGHRSIIANPCLPNGKDLVNNVKNREYYRPFAASILLEYVDEWFDMGRLKESPWMLFAVPIKEGLEKQVPAVIHLDGTCRIQTVTKNLGAYHSLIQKFYDKTGVPMVLNTSLNLAGEPLVHTKEDALRLFYNSTLDFIYFPDDDELLEKENNL